MAQNAEIVAFMNGIAALVMADGAFDEGPAYEQIESAIDLLREAFTAYPGAFGTLAETARLAVEWDDVEKAADARHGSDDVDWTRFDVAVAACNAILKRLGITATQWQERAEPGRSVQFPDGVA